MITEDRLKHILGVARNCYSISQKLGLNERKCKEMFTLGMMHDIGYELGDGLNHAEVGYDMLSTTGYTYAEEVKNHGLPECEYDSNELTILNLADFITSPQGITITPQERIDDMVVRFGEGSIPHGLAMTMYKRLEGSLKELGLI